MAEGQDEFSTLMMKVQLGDRQALVDLLACYEREVQQVARYLLGRRLQPRLDPSDLVQSVHRTLILGLRDNKITIQSQENLVRLAVVVARNKIARAARDLNYEQKHASPLVETAQSALETTRAEREDPAQVVEYNDMVQSLCRQLGEADRLLLQLRLEGHSTADIARMLNQNADVLRVRLSRLRQQLRQNNRLEQWI